MRSFTTPLEDSALGLALLIGLDGPGRWEAAYRCPRIAHQAAVLIGTGIAPRKTGQRFCFTKRR
jgi:hypothetical protein